ncbi:MAG: SH3 domain-containing protein [Heteroscytonema crispum UTEX LB 1556]
MNIKHLSENIILVALLTTFTILYALEVAQAQTNNCLTFIADANSPLNVRSNPRVEEGNIVGTLQDDTLVKVVDSRNEWLQIHAPMRGWVTKNRTTTECSNTQIQNRIVRLGEQAAKGDRLAANNLITLIPYSDGIATTQVTVALTKWAGTNPEFLVSVLDKKPQNTRVQALQMLNLGFNEGSQQQRQRFETAIREIPDSPTVQAWKSGVYQP